MKPQEFKAWRKTLGWSQEKAADELGVSKGSIDNYERGTRREDNRPVIIPKHVAIACAVLADIERLKFQSDQIIARILQYTKTDNPQ